MAGYRVGYGKPPQDHQFQKGQSGNPRGRPKGAKNLIATLTVELGKRIVIREGDRERPVSKQQALVTSVVNRGIKGDIRAARLIADLEARALPDTITPRSDTPLQPEEEAAYRAYISSTTSKGNSDDGA